MSEEKDDEGGFAIFTGAETGSILASLIVAVVNQNTAISALLAGQPEKGIESAERSDEAVQRLADLLKKKAEEAGYDDVG